MSNERIFSTTLWVLIFTGINFHKLKNLYVTGIYFCE